MLEVLQDFPSARPPLEWLLQTVPRLRPRLFSISSALTAFPAQAHITAAIVDWVTPFKRRRQVGLIVARAQWHSPSLTWARCLMPCGWHETGAFTLAQLPWWRMAHTCCWLRAGGVHIVACNTGSAADGGASAGMGRARRIRAACRYSHAAHLGGAWHRCRALPRISAAPPADSRWGYACHQTCYDHALLPLKCVRILSHPQI